ncbi:hypothetical protein [Burkholderia multivorans]|uniref:hypothetical protein n=1 Tax=Burkholderia multivorans TaxID=87883 RepID=UPI002158BA48|nr:hypothetical protein [Burkholderia multivorans]
MRTTSSNTYRYVYRTADALSRMLRFVLVLVFGLVSFAAYAVNESELLAPEQAFPLTVSLASHKEVVLDFKTGSSQKTENKAR